MSERKPIMECENLYPCSIEGCPVLTNVFYDGMYLCGKHLREIMQEHLYNTYSDKYDQYLEQFNETERRFVSLLIPKKMSFKKFKKVVK